jgi:hypothetical protein
MSRGIGVVAMIIALFPGGRRAQSTIYCTGAKIAGHRAPG